MTFLRRAADMGSLGAQTDLGVRLLNADPDSEEGLQLILAAVEAGHEDAIRLFQEDDDDRE